MQPTQLPAPLPIQGAPPSGPQLVPPVNVPHPQRPVLVENVPAVLEDVQTGVKYLRGKMLGKVSLVRLFA